MSKLKVRYTFVNTGSRNRQNHPNEEMQQKYSKGEQMILEERRRKPMHLLL